MLNFKLTSQGVRFDFLNYPKCIYSYLVEFDTAPFEVVIECGKEGYLGWIEGDLKPVHLPYRSFACLADAIDLTLREKGWL